ncbi:MAG: conjugal transfer protein TraC [Desulfobulbaceae bacterium]|nr:conjugal transfer protein TraC [Desulfobulbaceae bacterium]
MKHRDLENMIRRSPFSSFLNYLAHDPGLEIYLNQDCSFGMLWECTPVIYAGPKIITSLEGLFRAGLPNGSIIQLIFHADSHIEPILDRYRGNRTREVAIVRSNIEQRKRGCCKWLLVPVYTGNGPTWIPGFLQIPLLRT